MQSWLFPTLCCIYLNHVLDLSSSHLPFSPSAQTQQSVIYLILIKLVFSYTIKKGCIEWLFLVWLTPSTFHVKAEASLQAECNALQREYYPEEGASELNKSHHFICSRVNGLMSAGRLTITILNLMSSYVLRLKISGSEANQFPPLTLQSTQFETWTTGD